MSILMQAYIGVALVCIILLMAALILGIGHDLDHDMADGPSWVGVKVLLGAFAGFGLFGLAGFWFGLPDVATLAPALVGFFLMAFVVRNWIIVPMLKQQSNLLLSRDSYVDLEGEVVMLSILPGRPGTVQFRDQNGTPVYETAIASNPELSLAVGTRVTIVFVADGHVVVEQYPYSTQPQPRGN